MQRGGGNTIRVADGAMLYKDIIGGVQIEVIKTDDTATYDYHTEGIKIDLLSGFSILELGRERMFEKFDKYIFEFAGEDFAVDYWYDEGADIAENMLCDFDENDWEILLEVVPERPLEWKKRLAYCMHDKSDLNQLKVLLNLIETEDSELFETVVDSLRGFTSGESLNLIQTDSRIVSKIEALIPKVGDTTKRVFGEFLKKK